MRRDASPRGYLLCWSHTPNVQRAHRIDRVNSVDLLDGLFDPPVRTPISIRSPCSRRTWPSA